MKTLLIAGALSLTSHVAKAQTDAPAAQVTKISYNGTGCPINSGLTQTWESDELVVRFVDFVASRYDGSTLSDSRKNCVLTLDMTVPNGYSYSLSKVKGMGYAELKAGTQALVKSYYYFQGSAAQAELSQSFYGPYQQDFNFGGTIGLSNTIWSPCNLVRALNLNTSARVSQVATNQTADGLVVLDELRIGVQIRKCQ